MRAAPFAQVFRVFCLVLAAFTLSQLAEPACADPTDASFVAITAGRQTLSDGVTAVQTEEGLCLDLGEFVGALDFPIEVDAAAMTARGWFVNERQTVSLDLSGKRGEIAGLGIIWSDQKMSSINGSPCIDLVTLGDWFGLRLTYSMAEANVSVDSLDEELPVLARLARLERGAFSSAGDPMPGDEDPTAIIHGPYWLAAWPTLELQTITDLRRTSSRRRNTVSARAVVSGDFLLAAAEAQIDQDPGSGIPMISRFRLSRSVAEGARVGLGGFRSAALGDVNGHGGPFVTSGGGRGVEVSSYPVEQPDQFDRTRLEGPIPVGWDAELYRNGLLIASVADVQSGRYDFGDVPITFGNNDLEVRLYGPQGQTRIVRRQINAGGFQAPTGALYTRLAVYEPGKTVFSGDIPARRASDGHVDAAVSYGLGSAVSIGANLSLDRMAGAWRGVPSGSLQTSVIGTALDLHVAGASGGGRAALLRAQRPLPFGAVSSSILHASDGFGSSGVPPGLKTRANADLSGSLRLGAHSAIAASAAADLSWYWSGEEAAAIRTRANISRGVNSVSPFLTYQTSQTCADLLQGGFAFGTRYRGLGVRAAVEGQLLPELAGQAATVMVDRAIRRDSMDWHWSAESRLTPGSARPRLALSLARQFQQSSLALRLERDEFNSTNATMNLVLAVGRDARGWRVTSRPIAHSGTARVRVFEDVDDNRVFSARDTLLEGVRVNGNDGAYAASTSRDGLALIDGLETGRATAITLDLSGSDSPYTTRSVTRVVGRPGSQTRVDIPVVLAGSIDGWVSAAARGPGNGDGRRRPKPGIHVRLVDAAGGVVAQTNSAYDGFFCFESVPLGTYWLQSGAGAAAQITLDRDTPYVSDIAIEWVVDLARQAPVTASATRGTGPTLR